MTTSTVEAIKASLESIENSTTEAIGTVKSEVQSHTDRINQLEALAKRPGGPRHDNDNSDVKAERDALAVFARRGDDSKLREVHASMSVGSNPDGGYWVMPAVSSGMTKKLYDATPMRRLARVETITTGTDWIEPIDNSESGAVWVGEQTARPKTATPTLGELKVSLNEIYALQSVTQRLIDDSGFDLGSWLEGKITDKFIRTEGSAFITGNGIAKPRGFLTYNIVATKDATRAWGDLQYLPSGSASTILPDALKDTVWGLRTPYRTGASWLMNSNTAAVVDKLKDGQGNYLWRESYVAGVPPTLLGYNIEISEDMPDIAGGSTPIAFGNFRLAYVVLDRPGIRFLNDQLTDKPNYQVYAYRRVGGGLANSEALKVVKVSTT